MKIIKEGDEKVVKIIEAKKLDSKKMYRLSEFCYFYSEPDCFLIKNTMSGRVIQLLAKEKELLEQLKNKSKSFDFISDNGLIPLAECRLIVEEDYDEKKKYLSTAEILKIMKPEKRGIKTYKILPTLACNARCAYCYEKDYAKKSMAPETTERLVEYIIETKRDDEISLAWFGGEPLVGKNVISYVCGELRKREIAFKSSMISNGSLFTPETTDEAVNDWKLKKIQISLDGEKSYYEAVKAYTDPQKYNYEKVMDSIKLLSDRGVKVSLRCNYSRENLSGLKAMIDDLSERFAGNENVSLYFHIIFQQSESEDYSVQIAALSDLYAYCDEKGMKTGGNKVKGMRTNCCMADSMGSSIVIDPEGKLYNCEHLPENGSWGNIFDGITDEKRYKELNTLRPVEKECEKCLFLPYCTSFYKKGCPNSHKNCYEERKADLDRELHNICKTLAENPEM